MFSDVDKIITIRECYIFDLFITKFAHTNTTAFLVINLFNL